MGAGTEQHMSQRRPFLQRVLRLQTALPLLVLQGPHRPREQVAHRRPHHDGRVEACACHPWYQVPKAVLEEWCPWKEKRKKHPPVILRSYEKMLFVVSFPIQNGDAQ